MRNILFALAACFSLGAICTVVSAQDMNRGTDRGRDREGGFGIGTGIGIGIGIGEAISQQPAPQTDVRRATIKKKRPQTAISGDCLANIKEVKGSIPAVDLMNCYSDPGNKCTGACKLKDAAGSDVSQPARIPHLSGSAYSCECN
jgi:hypothetical protein